VVVIAIRNMQVAGTLAPKTDLDHMIEEVLSHVRFVQNTHGLPPSRAVVNRIIHKLTRAEIWKRASDSEYGGAFVQMLERCLNVDPLCPKIISGALGWENTIVYRQRSSLGLQLDWAPELLAAATIIVEEVVKAELLGS